MQEEQEQHPRQVNSAQLFCGETTRLPVQEKARQFLSREGESNMIKVFCDRCQREMPPTHRNIASITPDNEVTRHYELCDRCTGKLLGLLEMEDRNEDQETDQGD